MTSSADRPHPTSFIQRAEAHNSEDQGESILLKIGRRYTRKNNVRAMNGRERGRKHELRLKLRQGLRDLSTLTHLIEPRAPHPWFTERDAEEILNLNDLTMVVRFVVSLFGERYADRLLDEIARFYERQGKEVQVLKKYGRAGWESKIGI